MSKIGQLLFVLAISAISFGQTAGRPSPPEHAQCKFSDGKTINVDYSSPRMKGRKIFGELVPFGKVWRTGANEATKFVTDSDLVAGGTSIPSGAYTMFTIPNPDSWALIINKHTGEWGIPYKYESEELPHVPMTVKKLSAPVENFTITFDQTGSGCTMRIGWETTEASVELKQKK